LLNQLFTKSNWSDESYEMLKEYFALTQLSKGRNNPDWTGAARSYWNIGRNIVKIWPNLACHILCVLHYVTVS